MSKRSQEKRRARAKEKEQAKRRMMGTSPLARLAGDSQACECWVSYQSQDNRMRSLHVFRPVRGGSHVAAFFLIDYDCIGLKDAFYRLDVNIGEMREMLRERSRYDQDLKFVKISAQEAQKMVAGGIKWTRAHPYFRMPAETERCMKILGGVDLEGADVTEFGTEDGGLLYVGREADLRRRLMGMTVEEFMDTEGVEVAFHMGDETFREEEEFDEEWDEDDPARPVSEAERVEREEAEELLLKMQQKTKAKIVDGARRWCFANQKMAEPELERAVDLMMDSVMHIAGNGSQGKDEDQELGEKAIKGLAELLVLENPEQHEAVMRAYEQLGDYMKTFKNPEEMFAAHGVGEEQLEE